MNEQQKPEIISINDHMNLQGIADIAELLGNENLTEDGTLMSFACQAANFIKYVHSETTFDYGVCSKSDNVRKENVVVMLSLLSKEIDVSEFDPYNFGVGNNELRYFSIDSEGNPLFESNNVHDWARGEDAYKVFAWEELTDYEKPAIEDVLKQIVKQNLAV